MKTTAIYIGKMITQIILKTFEEKQAGNVKKSKFKHFGNYKTVDKQ